MTDTDSTRRTALKLLGVGAVATAGSGLVAATHHDDEKPDHDDAEKKTESVDDHLEKADVHGLYVARLLPQEGVETDASGLAVFQHRDDELTFALTLANIENTFMSHVHEDEPLGPVAVWLHDFETQDEELVEGPFTGLLDAGTITDDVIQAGRVPEAESQTVQQLVEKIEAGETYVNVHTEEYPGGELAGQIEPFDVRQLHDLRL
ncbi:CHRD domain-containing protein [Natronococcus pandeyae]|uniref:CHRD domain-containing protein n=1 Tax=Natronococcus pandeyae TaxID=2055836 RepID=A0A8J8TR87_9EURY|nr:CHRD domain-containing protein [Natronococcus pandeyae]TYL39681.1 CHRD domain-containing protein [Natronococcus pandeyae]